MLTGHGDQALSKLHGLEGIDHFINKPFRLEALREGIARAFTVCAARGGKDSPVQI
jgi:FixJ family two-component response regulator